MNIIKKFKAFLRFREAVRRADAAHEQGDHRRYYVLPSKNGKLVIMDRKNFRELRRKRYIDRNITVRAVADHCLYHTPDAGGMGGTPNEYLREKFNDYIKFIKENEKKKGKA